MLHGAPARVSPAPVGDQSWDTLLRASPQPGTGCMEHKMHQQEQLNGCHSFSSIGRAGKFATGTSDSRARPADRDPMSLLAAGAHLGIDGILSHSTPLVPSPATGFRVQKSYFGLDFSVLLILKSQFISVSR